MSTVIKKVKKVMNFEQNKWLETQAKLSTDIRTVAGNHFHGKTSKNMNHNISGNFV